jgi:intraflagellar transport protein 46
MESDSSVLSGNCPISEQVGAKEHQRWEIQEIIKDLKHQPYDCMLEIDGDDDGNETIDTDGNSASSDNFVDNVFKDKGQLTFDRSNNKLGLHNGEEADRNKKEISKALDLDEFIKENEQGLNSVLTSIENSIETSESRSPMVSTASHLGHNSGSAEMNLVTSSAGVESKEQTIAESSNGNAIKSSRGKSGAHNPADYLHLNVSDELQKLFLHIDQYKPEDIALDATLKPFIPAYIPAIGEVDNFLKVPRPDGEEEKLGISSLDEPALHQTDPAVLELQLQVHSKKRNSITVRSLEGDVSLPYNKLQIENWINSIDALRKTKHSEKVSYKIPMPHLQDILMEPWPEDFNEAIKNETIVLPDANLDMSLAEYGKLLCSILDIPVHKGHLIESIHLLFSLYMEFKASTVSFFFSMNKFYPLMYDLYI